MRHFLDQFSPAEQDFLRGVFQRSPGAARRFELIARTPANQRTDLIPAMQVERLHRFGSAFGIPELWRENRSERARERARLAEWFAPEKLRDPKQAAHWAHADECVRGMRDHVTNQQGVRADERQQLGSLTLRLMLEHDRYGYKRTMKQLYRGDSQLSRWVADTGRLQTLHRALHLESQLPELRDAFTMVWARSGGGEVRSEAGRKLRTALIIERAAMHAGERPRRDYEGDKPLMRIMAKMPEKAGLYERLTGAQPVVATSEPLPVMARRTPQA
jgi:hypothetical protein